MVINSSNFLRNDEDNDVRSIASVAHYIKGRCGTIGITKVRALVETIQDTAYGDSPIEDTSRLITQLVGETKDAFVNAHQRLRAFYREPKVEIEW
jgi:HPt (histidine-containing phosphotransfer) domain-containing protein